MSQTFWQKEIPFFPSCALLAACVAKHENAFFLYSSDTQHVRSRFSYVGLCPSSVFWGAQNPWDHLKLAVRDLPARSPAAHFFGGGLVGYLGYETHGFLDGFSTSSFESPIPNYWFGWYDSILVLDHRTSRAFVHSSMADKKLLDREWDCWMTLLEENRMAPIAVRPRVEDSGFCTFPNYGIYEKKIRMIQDYLRAGDVYQVNYTERFGKSYRGNVADLFVSLNALHPVPYAGWIHAKEWDVLSLSPECFFAAKNNIVTSYPVKGTAARGANKGLDLLLQNKLRASPKDRAELLMITDLVRNDLGKVCAYGSVKTTQLYALETFSHVHHLVSTVTGSLRNDKSVFDVLLALFPGGSITGAPKRRAMEIIHTLETSPRAVYTGALGYIGGRCEAEFNIPIRTLYRAGDMLYFHSGGGIVMDSDPQSEYAEMMTKVGGLFEALLDPANRQSVTNAQRFIL